MARENAAARQAREALEREEAEKRAAEYKVKLPSILLRYIAWAQSRGDVQHRVTYHDTAPGGCTVKFMFPTDEPGGVYNEITIHPDTEEWDVEQVEAAFARLERKDEERARTRAHAESGYAKLSTEERAALGVRKP